MNLFCHRRDVFSEQQDSGAYFPVRQPITTDDVAEHLAGLASYGSYVIRPGDQSVRYVVFDLDTHDEGAQEHLCYCAMRLVQLLVNPEQHQAWDLRFRCLLYEASGNKGTHVWLFLSAPLPAAQVRRWVTRDFMPAWEEKAKPAGWPIEVYPKQDSVDEGGFGNLVKLPLGKHRVSGNFSHFISQTGWATSVDDVVPLPSELVPDVPVAVGGDRRRDTGERVRSSATDGPCSPFPCVDRIMREGVPQGYRDNAMFHLALYCYGHGIDQDLAEEVCVRANEEFDPPMPEREVRSKVSSAYRGRYPSATCGSGWLAELCPGPCKTGWSVRSTEGGALKSAQPGSSVDVEVVQTVREEGRTRVTVKHPDAANTPTFLVGR